MICTIKGINICYETKGCGFPVVFLHGWGANKFTFNTIASHISQSYKAILIDLPGFGESYIEEALNVGEVSEILHQFLVALKIDNPIIIAHSYGGRIAIKYASKYDVEKLVLVSSAGIKQRISLSKRVRVLFYKTMKKMKINVNMGSTDYKNASVLMKKMLVLTVNEDLAPLLTKIEAPTLLIWGSNDKTTKMSDAKRMEQMIKDCGIVVMEGCGHFPYLQKPINFKIIVDSFLSTAYDD